LERVFEAGASSSGSSESRSRHLCLRRWYSIAKQQMKMPARQLLTRIVRARTFIPVIQPDPAETRIAWIAESFAYFLILKESE